MRNIFLSFIMLFNNLYVKNEVCEVEKIEYSTNNNYNNNLTLDIRISSNIRDVLQLTIYFYDSNKELLNNKYFSSSLIIQGTKDTKAKLPIKVENKIYLNIIVYSGNLEREIENIMFPVYPKERSTCNLSFKKNCKSIYPSLIVYEGGTIFEEYEEVALINKGLDLVSFNNLLPLNKIRLISNLRVVDGYSFLSLEEKLENIDIYYEDKYIFPLKLNDCKNMICFELLDRYYINLFEGKMSENYLKNGVLVKEIMLPYNDKEYVFTIEMKNSFISFETVTLDFKVTTKGNLLGNCNNSKYCLRRNYL